MRRYIVEYRLHKNDSIHQIQIYAKNKYDAYDRAFYDWIPYEYKTVPYSAWVVSYETKAGKIYNFNSFEGNPFGE